MEKPLLLGCAGCGSVITEFGFNLAGIAYDYEEVDYGEGSATRARLLEVNPLGQVPALVIPGARGREAPSKDQRGREAPSKDQRGREAPSKDQTVMTESLAMLHWIQDEAPGAPLIPPKGDAARPAFYRWAVFLVAAVYPTYTYGDDAKKWVGGDETAGKALRESTNVHRQNMLKQMEAACGAPHFLGKRFSAIDLYLAAMSHWRPGRDWWKANVPKLLAAADAAIAKPEVGKVVKRDFK